MKKYIYLIILIVLITVIIFILSKDKKSIYLQGKVVDTNSQIENYEKNTRRKGLLISIEETTSDNFYNYDNVYQLDQNDPESKVLIDSYATDFGVKVGDPQYPGGIIMLKRLPDGQNSIFWEVSSPLLGRVQQAGPVQVVEDINKDGLIDIIVPWFGGIDDRQDSELWILSIDQKNKKYRVLNVVVDEKGEVIKDFDFEHPDPNKTYLNRFQSHDGQSSKEIIKDFEGDGIYEIVIKKPQLEWYGILKRTPGIPFIFTQVYKWNGTEYYLWKEIEESPNDYFWNDN